MFPKSAVISGEIQKRPQFWEERWAAFLLPGSGRMNRKRPQGHQLRGEKDAQNCTEAA